MLGQVAQRYSSHSASSKSVVTLSFPITKCALWDHTPTGSTVNVHLAYYRNVEIHVEKKVLQLAQRYADDSGSNRYHCLLTGSVLSEIDGEGVKLLLDRFDPGRDNAGFSPSAMVPGDISIPCIMQKKDANSTSQASVSDYITVLKMLEQRCGTNDKVELINFFILKCLSKYAASGSDISLAMEFDFITLATSLKATPISSVPIMPTALSKNLMGPMNMSNLQGEPKMGYLTMDHTRKLLLILQSDPKVQTLPLVGIWVTGVRYVYDPYVWCSCLRYLHNNSIQERVCAAPEAFLVALFSPLHSKPEFYECLTEDKTSRLKFELNTCLESVELTQSVQYRPDDCLVFDLQKVDNGAKMQAFTSATEALKQAIPEKDKPQKPLTEISVNIDDLMPRSSPSPHQTKAPVIQPQVPEVSLLFDDEGVKSQPPRMPLGYSVFKQRNDENSPVLNESNAHRNKSALQSQSSSVRAPLKTLNRDINSKAKMSQSSRLNRENVSVEKTSTHDYSRRISLESKSEQEENTDTGSPGGYFGVSSSGPFPGSAKGPSSHGMRMRSPNMAPAASQSGQYGMRYTSPPYMGPRAPYSDQYYHPGMQLHPGSTGSPPGMYPMPPRGGYPVRGQMPRHPYGGYMPRPYPGQYAPRGPPVTGPGPYYPQSQGNRYPVPPYRPAQYRSSPPQPMNTFTSTSDTMVPPPRNVAQEFNPSPSTNMPSFQPVSSHIVSSVTTALQTASSNISSGVAATNGNSCSIQTSHASPSRDSQPHGAIPPLTPSAGEPSLPLSSPGSITTNMAQEKPDNGHEVNGVAVTPEVYKLLKQQDTQLKLLQAQLQKLLANQEPKEQEVEKPSVDSSADSYQSIMKKFQSTPSKKSCSIATNTSLFFSGPASPQRSRLGNRDVADVKVTDSCKGKRLSLGSETIVAEHQPNSLGGTTDEDDDETTNGTETTNNNSFTFSMQMMTLQDGTMESSMSDMIVDLPCYDTGSGGDDPDSQDIRSVSMYSHQDSPPVMPCEMGDEQLVPGKEDNSREYYENLIGNIHDLLNKIPASSHQGSVQSSVNSSLVDQEPVRDVAMATLEHLKKIGIYNEKDENDSYGVNKTLINVEAAVLHKINYVSMMFDDNSDTDVSMEVNALAMKYLSDDQLSQMAKLSTTSRARRAARSSQNILQRVMHNKAADQSSNVTLYGMAANNMSFATKKYMERYGLLDGGKSGTNASLCLDGVDADDTCANMSVLNQEYLRVPPQAWHNMSLDEEPSKLEASDHAESRSSPLFAEKDDKFSAPHPNIVPSSTADHAPVFIDRFVPVTNQNNDFDQCDSLMSRGQASSFSSECSSYCGDSCTSGEFCPGCVIPRPRSDTLPLGSPRRVEKGRRRSEGEPLHDSCPDFTRTKPLDSSRSMTRSPAANPDCHEQYANTTADSASTTDHEVRKILEKPIGSFETDTVFSVEESQAAVTAEDDGFRVFDRPAREMKREPLPQQADLRVMSYSLREESVCETILDIQRLKQLPKLL
ncbi:SCL-interrupting locus protein homolog [Lineus longissimus]|uniref:SCL-interrupting locus protein homolog n=1 Tax=Lineus longissimus TaxID=88925 RepID=UPI00315C5CEF